MNKKLHSVVEYNNTRERKILDYLEDNPVIAKSIDMCLWIRENNLEYYEGLNTLNYYEIYMLVYEKIKCVFSLFIPNTIFKDDNLYNELKYSHPKKYSEYINSHLIDELSELLNITKEEVIINKEEKLNYENYRGSQEINFYLELENKLNNQYYVIFLNELDNIINNFLSKFKENIKFSYDIDENCVTFHLIKKVERKELNYIPESTYELIKEITGCEYDIIKTKTKNYDCTHYNQIKKIINLLK